MGCQIFSERYDQKRSTWPKNQLVPYHLTGPRFLKCPIGKITKLDHGMLYIFRKLWPRASHFLSLLDPNYLDPKLYSAYPSSKLSELIGLGGGWSGNVQGNRVMEYIRFKGHSVQKGPMGAEICFCRDFFSSGGGPKWCWIIQLCHRVATICQGEEHAVRVSLTKSLTKRTCWSLHSTFQQHWFCVMWLAQHISRGTQSKPTVVVPATKSRSHENI